MTRSTLILTLALLSALPLMAESVLPLEREFASGSRVQIYPADYVRDHFLRQAEDRPFLQLPGSPPMELAPMGETLFFEHDSEEAMEALLSLSYPRPVERIEIVFLPLPLREHSHSFAQGNRIFLAPAEMEIPEEITHMTVVHELGHLFQYAKMSDLNTSLWSQYRQLRGISDEGIYHDSAIHANRPHEVFAEDFRYLFGGELANYSGTIENHDLALPDEVFGLREFFLSLSDKIAPASLLQSSCFPNPFNPRTTVKVDAEVALIGEDLTVRVFDARGRQVRELYRGALFTQSLSFHWDGRDDRNQALPSGVYFSRIRVGDHRAGNKMILLQ